MSTNHSSPLRARFGRRLAVLGSVLALVLLGTAAPASANLQTVTVGAQSGTITAGTAGSATYVVTVTRSFRLPRLSLDFGNGIAGRSDGVVRDSLGVGRELLCKQSHVHAQRELQHCGSGRLALVHRRGVSARKYDADDNRNADRQRRRSTPDDHVRGAGRQDVR